MNKSSLSSLEIKDFLLSLSLNSYRFHISEVGIWIKGRFMTSAPVPLEGPDGVRQLFLSRVTVVLSVQRKWAQNKAEKWSNELAENCTVSSHQWFPSHCRLFFVQNEHRSFVKFISQLFISLTSKMNVNNLSINLWSRGCQCADWVHPFSLLNLITRWQLNFV